MQQKLFNCQQMVKAIRNAIRKEANKLDTPITPGMIKISLVPATPEADEVLGGLSDIPRRFPEKLEAEDFATYEYTYALRPEVGLSASDSGSYANICIKKRSLITGNHNEGTTERVYVWDDYLDITVRVSGADSKNKTLAKASFGAINSFFEERLPDFSVKLS